MCPDEEDFHRLMTNFRKLFGNTEEGGKFLESFGYQVKIAELRGVSRFSDI